MIDSTALSFVGRRQGNEDACIACALGDETYFLAVADGMGGTEGGEVASNLVLERARTYIAEALSAGAAPEDFKKILTGMFGATQEAVHSEKNSHPELHSMGSTLACVLIKGSKFVVGHIGDSRVYLLRDRKLLQITEDHTYVQEMIKETGKRPDASFVQIYGHYITKSIEGGSDRPDLYPAEDPWGELQDGEAVLICSDGLITDKGGGTTESMEEILVCSKSLQVAAEQLICGAFHAGSTDNISVVLATYGNFKREHHKYQKSHYPPTEKKVQTAPASGQKRLHWTQGRAPVYLLFIMIVVVLGGISFLYHNDIWDALSSFTKSVFVDGEKADADNNSRNTPEARSDRVKPRSHPITRDTVKEPDATAWQPFEEGGFPLSIFLISEDKFGWIDYPRRDRVKEYRLVFKELGSRSPSITFLSKGNSCSLKGRGIHEGEYEVTVSVILNDASDEPKGKGNVYFKE